VIKKNLSFFLLSILFVFFANSELLAQTSKKDSVLNAIKIKRTQDSLARVEMRLQLQKQRDSLQNSIKAKRRADSLARVVVVLERVNERKKQDSIIAFNKKFTQDSIEASKKGITITLKGLLQEKENEKIRLKILEEKIAKQRIEDSIYVAIKKSKEKEEKRIQDSIALVNKKIEEQKKIALLVEEKRIQDSIILAKQIEKENQRIAKEKLLVEEKRIQDSIVSAKLIEKENQRMAKEKMLVEQKRIKDSIKYANPNFTIEPNIKDTLLSVKDPIQKKATYLSFNFGLSNYLGDIGANSSLSDQFLKNYHFTNQTFMYGISLTKNWREAVGLRFSYHAGKVAGSDSDVPYKDPNDVSYDIYKRNLDFTTKLSEWSAMIEIYPFKILNRKKGLFQSALQPYGLLGIGRFTFNPQGSYYDEISQDYVLVDLAPLKTEGQGMVEYADRKPYELTQTNIPFGVGINYLLGAKTSMSFEFVGRKLFTDYLDDVSTTYIDPSVYRNYFSGEDLEIAQLMTNKSAIIDPNQPYGVGGQRGNSKNNDFYYSFNIKLNIQINKVKK
jgi:hypothetical protein